MTKKKNILIITVIILMRVMRVNVLPENILFNNTFISIVVVKNLLEFLGSNPETPNIGK